MLPPTVSFSLIVALAENVPPSLLSDEFGTMPRTSSFVRDSRAPAFSADVETFRLFDSVLPVRKNWLTLSGCAIHGCALPLNWSQPTVVSYTDVFGLNTQPLVRPSSFGPQDSSAPSFTPPPAPST